MKDIKASFPVFQFLEIKLSIFIGGPDE